MTAYVIRPTTHHKGYRVKPFSFFKVGRIGIASFHTVLSSANKEFVKVYLRLSRAAKRKPDMGRIDCDSGKQKIFLSG